MIALSALIRRIGVSVAEIPADPAPHDSEGPGGHPGVVAVATIGPMSSPPPLTPLAAAVLHAGNPERVLQVACGDGDGALFLAREFPAARVRGIDATPSWSARRRRRVGLDPRGGSPSRSAARGGSPTPMITSTWSRRSTPARHRRGRPRPAPRRPPDPRRDAGTRRWRRTPRMAPGARAAAPSPRDRRRREAGTASFTVARLAGS